MIIAVREIKDVDHFRGIVPCRRMRCACGKYVASTIFWEFSSDERKGDPPGRKEKIWIK